MISCTFSLGHPGFLPQRGTAAQADTFPRCAASNGRYRRDDKGSGRRQRIGAFTAHRSIRYQLVNLMDEETHMDKVIQTKKKRRVSISTVLLVAIMLAGAAIFLYPSVSDWWNSMHATQAIAGYVSAVEDMSEEEKAAMLEAAHAYNKALPDGVNFSLTEEQYAEYEKVLDVTGTGIMGYVQVKSIGVNLPIYHGVDEGILQVAIGHIPGSSLPVGGERTHCVVSGHRGLPRAKLFSDLDKVGEGDTFTVTVLDETATYMVDQIRIVLPEETDDLAIVNGADYCTLTTCTPYGINSHRILMRGHRIANLGDAVTPAEAVRIPTYIVIPAVGIPILFIVLAGMLIHYRRRPAKKSSKEMLDELRK